MHPMLNIAIRAARAAGSVVARAFENTDKVVVEAKGKFDFVTNFDLEAEQIIIDTLRSINFHIFRIYSSFITSII